MSLSAHLASVGGTIFPFLFVLSIVVFFHEMGHFVIGRLCGVKVDTFSLGFGPEVAAFVDRWGTRWRLGVLPLGGYVKFHGDANGASMTDTDAAAAMPEAEKKVTFFGQNVWKRAAIVVAGPLANFVLAIAIFTGIFTIHGRGVLLPQVDKIAHNSAAEAAGFKPNDVILSIDGRKVDSFEDVQRIVQVSSNTPLTFIVTRGGRDVTLVATPRQRSVTSAVGLSDVGVLGVEAKAIQANWHVQRYGVVKSFQLATSETWYVIDQTGAYARGLILGRESTSQLSGPIRIAEVSGEMAKVGFAALLNLAAVLSISIGILNLLPIPLLDGGHLVYYAIEAVRGKALNEKVQQVGFRIGLTFVLGLMILATYNDILRLTK
jgi:regulator of sigma E protease